MRKLIIFACMTFGSAILSPDLGTTGDGIGMATAAAQEGARCSAVGSWYGYDPVPTTPTWMANVTGQSADFGIQTVELTGFDATLGGTFTTTVRTTFVRGVWKRMSGRSFAITALALGVDAQGHTTYIAKMRNTNTLSDDCNVVTVQGLLEIFSATQDPFASEPLFAVPLPVHNGYRMSVQPLE